MPKIITPLNDAKIKKAKAKDKGYKLFDGAGLFLWVNTTGGKLWRLKYKSPINGKEKTYSIGKYPDIKLATARTERERLRQLIGNGIDPSLEKQKIKKSRIEKQINETNTFGKVANKFLLHKIKNLDSYNEMQLKRLEKHIFPSLENVPIKEISRSDIIGLIKIIEKNGKFEMASRVFSLCNEIFRYAAANEIISHNLLADIDKKNVFIGPENNHFLAVNQLTVIENNVNKRPDIVLFINGIPLIVI